MSGSDDRGGKPPIDPVRTFREAIAACDIDARTMIETILEEGAIEPGVLTRFGAEQDAPSSRTRRGC